jgi:hypothetical protein
LTVIAASYELDAVPTGTTIWTMSICCCAAARALRGMPKSAAHSTSSGTIAER